MKTVILGSQPPEIEAFLARRARLGQNTHDEMWEGELHVNPAPTGGHSHLQAQLMMTIGPRAKSLGLWPTVEVNLGGPDNYRVPDAAIFRDAVDQVWYSTTAAAIAVRSPDDESYDKFDHYAAHDVDEVWIVEPVDQTVRMWQLTNGTYEETARSTVLDLEATSVARDLTWPPPS